MALIVRVTNNFIEIALDGVANFNAEVDLTAYSISRNAPDGLRVRKITFVPSQTGDEVIVRDGINGPRVFTALGTLGDYDILRDEYNEDSNVGRGKLMSPYVAANESVVGIVNQAFLVFEL